MRGRVCFSNLEKCYSINNRILYNNKPLIDLDYVVYGIECHGSCIYSFGTNHFTSVSLSGEIQIKKIFTSWILDMKIDQCGILSLMDGTIYDIALDKLTRTKYNSIISSKIVSRELIFLGLYNSVVFDLYNLEHDGRVFCVNHNQWGTVTAGEDRKINIVDQNGLWYVQEHRNYVIKCGLYREYLYTVNRDGTFKLYSHRRLIFELETCFLGISDVFINEEKLLIGLSNGEILSYRLNISQNGTSVLCENSVDNSDIKKHLNVISLFGKSGDRDMALLIRQLTHLMRVDDQIIDMKKDEYLANSSDHLPVSKNKKSRSYTFDDVKVTVINNIVYFGSELHILEVRSAVLNVFSSRKYLILLLKKSVVYIDKFNFNIHQETFVSKPSVVCGSIIGTKNGWIINGTVGFKLCDEDVLDIYRSKRRIYVLTCKNFFILDPLDLNYLDERICGKIEHLEEQRDIVMNNRAYSVMFREHGINSKSIKLHKNKFIYDENMNNDLFLTSKYNVDVFFREITTAIKFSGFFVCGSAERKIILFDKEMKILDVIYVDGQVAKVIRFKERLICGTKRGLIYILKVFKKKLFIIQSVKISLKIIDIYFEEKLFVLDSGGHFRTFSADKMKEESRVKLSDLSLRMLRMRGAFYFGTSNGKLIELNNSTWKLASLSIFSMIKVKDCIYLAGDDHSVIRFNVLTNKVIKKTIMSDPIVQLLHYKRLIIVLSRSGVLKVVNEDLDVVRSESLACGVMNCMIKYKEGVICFGTSIIKLKI